MVYKYIWIEIYTRVIYLFVYLFSVAHGVVHFDSDIIGEPGGACLFSFFICFFLQSASDAYNRNCGGFSSSVYNLNKIMRK